MERIKSIKEIDYLLKFAPDNPGLQLILSKEVNLLIEELCLVRCLSCLWKRPK